MWNEDYDEDIEIAMGCVKEWNDDTYWDDNDDNTDIDTYDEEY